MSVQDPGFGARLSFPRLDVTAGYRFGGGVDAAARVSFEQQTYQERFRIGPVVGVSRRLGLGATGRIEAAALYSTSDVALPDAVLNDGTPWTGYAATTRVAIADLTVSVSRPVRLAGSVQLRPTVGGFGTAYHRLSHRTNSAEPTSRRSMDETGLHLELPVTFRLLGQSVSAGPVGRFRLTGGIHNPRSYGGGGLRVNF